MRRGLIIALSVTGVLLVVLAVALASVGTNVDLLRIERDELQYEVDDLQREVDTLSGEREQLQQQLEERLRIVEQQKAELERLRNSHASRAEASQAPAPAGEAP